MKISEIKKQIKGVFKQPVKKYYIGKMVYGCPYYYPWNFNKSIISIRKTKPIYRLNPLNFKLFGYNIYIGSPIWFSKADLGWKDKFNTPRHEWNPQYQLLFFGLEFHCWWCCPINENTYNNDKYWEQILWYLKYSDKDIKKAEETWPWRNYDTELSSWNKDYLI